MNAIEQAAISFLDSYGYLAIFVLMALETAMILHFVPSEVIMTVGAAAVAHDRTELLLVVIVATVGATVGSLMLYAFARFGGRTFLERHSHMFGLNAKRRARMDAWFQKPSGESLVFFFRLLPFLRAAVSIPAGLARMDWRKFTIYSAAGSAIFNAALAYTTYAAQHDPGFNAQLTDARDYVASRWPLLVAVLLVLAGVAYVAYRRRHRYLAEPHRAVRHFWGGAAILAILAGALILGASLLFPASTYRAVTYVFVDAEQTATDTGTTPLIFLLGVAATFVTIGLAALSLTPLLEWLARRFGPKRT